MFCEVKGESTTYGINRVMAITMLRTSYHIEAKYPEGWLALPMVVSLGFLQNHLLLFREQVGTHLTQQSSLKTPFLQ